MGMKPIAGVSRVVMKKSKNMLFVIAKPEVYKSPVADTYIVFGEAKIEDVTKTQAYQQQQQQQYQQQQRQQQPYSAPDAAKAPILSTSTVAADEGEVDETGVSAKDIELVVGQAGCSRAAAVQALRNNENDIVNAIMELTM
jgi:nascent polypeptide-associated complex subunit alpha